MAIKPKYGYYPANFDLEQFCAFYKFKPSKVILILNNFVQNTKKKEFKERQALNAEILKNSIGNDYNKIIAALIDAEVLLHTKGYVIGVSSNEYQLTSNYLDCAELKEFQYIDETPDSLREINSRRQKEKFAKELKIPKLQRKTEMPYEMFVSNYQPLLEWIYDKRLKFNQEKALQILENSEFAKSKRKQDRNKYTYYLASIISFKEDNIYANCDYNYRFYTNLTSLPKIFRCCLSFDGVPLAGYDISNTHPILLANLCDSFFIRKLVRENAIDVDSEILSEFLEHLKSKPSDLIEYKKLVLSGLLYDEFLKYLPMYTRNEIKKKFLAIINDDNYDYNSQIKFIRNILSLKFPTISRLLELIKSKNYKYASSILMTMEAQNFVIKFPHELKYKLESEGKEPLPLFTIHDCFITTSNRIEELRIYLEAYFQEILGMDVPLKQQIF
jgi:hypothetical protein